MNRVIIILSTIYVCETTVFQQTMKRMSHL